MEIGDSKGTEVRHKRVREESRAEKEHREYKKHRSNRESELEESEDYPSGDTSKEKYLEYEQHPPSPPKKDEIAHDTSTEHVHAWDEAQHQEERQQQQQERHHPTQSPLQPRKSKFGEKLVKQNAKVVHQDELSERDLGYMPQLSQYPTERYRDYSFKRENRGNGGRPRQVYGGWRNNQYQHYHRQQEQDPYWADSPPAQNQELHQGAPPPPGGSVLPGVKVTLEMATVFVKPLPTTTHQKEPSETKVDPNRHFRKNEEVPEELKLFEERRKAFKEEVSRIIVKRLSKYYNKKQIATKEDFKHLSRKLCHKVMKKEEPKGYVKNAGTEKKIKKYVDAFFVKRGGVYSRQAKKTAWEAPAPLRDIQ